MAQRDAALAPLAPCPAAPRHTVRICEDPGLKMRSAKNLQPYLPYKPFSRFRPPWGIAEISRWLSQIRVLGGQFLMRVRGSFLHARFHIYYDSGSSNLMPGVSKELLSGPKRLSNPHVKFKFENLAPLTCSVQFGVRGERGCDGSHSRANSEG